jgi:thiosulfate reductase cytochrome b subunit
VRQQLYSWYERTWHWLQAATTLLLIATGVSIHAPDRFGWLPFDAAVRIHNFLGFFLLTNAFLGMFYYLTTGTLRQYIPEPRDFASLAFRQAMYYIRGMFRGEPHPLNKTVQQRLNPLQQVTYLIILNVLLPLQMITGLLMWGGQRWPDSVRAVGGLPALGLVHTLGAWLFGAFVMMHVYLTTTGHTPLSNIKAMVTGYEDIPASHPAPVVATARQGTHEMEDAES